MRFSTLLLLCLQVFDTVAKKSKTCRKDDCYNAVAVQGRHNPAKAVRVADCSSVLSTLIDDTTITRTLYITSSTRLMTATHTFIEKTVTATVSGTTPTIVKRELSQLTQLLSLETGVSSPEPTEFHQVGPRDRVSWLAPLDTPLFVHFIIDLLFSRSLF